MIGKLMANLIIHLSTWILLKIIASHTRRDVDEFYWTRARGPKQRCSPFPTDLNRLDWRSRWGIETTGVLVMADVNQGAPCTPVRSPDQQTPRF
jgi:hypothetical protein